MRSPKVAICFFGITRSLRHTLSSIEANVIGPARATGETRIFAHFFTQKRLDNVDTGEVFDLDPEEYRLLQPDEVRLEEPDACLEEWDFDTLRHHGDAWNNGFRSLRNLVHQLHSVRTVTGMAASWGPDVWVFARPDLRYHDDLRPVLAAAMDRDNVDTLWLPLWQSRGGRNDRFAVVKGSGAAKKYGMRAERMMDYCRTTGQPLHAERLLGFALRGERVRLIASRATRIRANGFEWYESFSFEWLERMHILLEKGRAPHLFKRAGHRGLQTLQQVAEVPFPR